MTDADDAVRTLLGPEPWEATWARFIHWLVREADPDDRHRVVLGWNWDGGFEVPSWIGSRPDCDRATALVMFWNGSPEYYVEFGGERSRIPEVNASGYDFLQDVRTRWERGSYIRSELSFSLSDASTWTRDFDALDAAFGDRARVEMPVDMRQPLAGRALTAEGFIEGMPARLWD